MMHQAIDGLPVYGTTIVGMRLDGIKTVQILEYDPVENLWIWQNDWYEGQTAIEFLWAAPIDKVVPEK